MSETIEGRWWNISKHVERVIEARYDKLKDWVMDPKGYFLIKVDHEAGLVRAGFCTVPGNRMVAEVRGTSAIAIVNTILREGMVSSMQHAADMGIELCKAELALRHGLTYVQDGVLELKRP